MGSRAAPSGTESKNFWRDSPGWLGTSWMSGFRVRAARFSLPPPGLEEPDGLVPPAALVAAALGVPAHGPTRAVAAVPADECRDPVDAGAVRDGRIDRLAHRSRQSLDRRAPPRHPGRVPSAQLLHGPSAPTSPATTLTHSTRPMHRTMVRGPHSATEEAFALDGNRAAQRPGRRACAARVARRQANGVRACR